MKFSTREDIEAPITHVFARVTDFSNFERRALRAGAHISRSDEGPVGIGTSWTVLFTFRGRERSVASTLTELTEPTDLKVESVSDGMTVETNVALVALSPGRTRLMVGMELRARTLTARLLLQSMKLAKGKLQKRFKARVLNFAEEIEDSYRNPTA